jgi:prepilin-type N-terminal cleavage/methylation domain-containing protein
MHEHVQMKNSLRQQLGFTLIELMIVMSIVALLLSLVGPMAIQNLEKAEAKQEMLMMKNWLKKISYRASATGQQHQLKLSGNTAELYMITTEQNESSSHIIITKTFNSLFFKPQQLTYSAKGFVTPDVLQAQYRSNDLTININHWVNGAERIDVLDASQGG